MAEAMNGGCHSGRNYCRHSPAAGRELAGGGKILRWRRWAPWPEIRPHTTGLLLPRSVTTITETDRELLRAGSDNPWWGQLAECQQRPAPAAEPVRWIKLTLFPVMASKVSTLVSAGIATVAAASFLQAAPANAILYIDLIPISDTRTRIQVSGSLDRSLLPTGAGNAAAGGNATDSSGTNTSRLVVGANDQLRFTYTPTPTTVGDNPGQRWRISGPTNPFTGSNANFLFVSPPTPTNVPFFILRPTNGVVGLGGQDFWLPNTYATNSAFSGFMDIDATLAQIGLVTPNVVYNIGGEQIILRERVPGPLPLLGAAAAFGYSRKLRKRINKPQRTQAV